MKPTQTTMSRVARPLNRNVANSNYSVINSFNM